MAKINGFFGSLSGPFAANEEIFTLIEEQCINNINYLSKIGIHYAENFDLNVSQNNQYIVKINNIDFQIGKTRMLELQDVEITSIKFLWNTDDRVYIDYQYVPISE